MAGENKRIQDLPPINSSDVATNDVFPIVDVSGFETKKVRLDQLKIKITEDSQPKLPTGTDGQVLKLVTGEPTWANADDGTSPIKYWGDPNSEGTWRQRVSGTFFIEEFRRDGAWVEYSRKNSEDV